MATIVKINGVRYDNFDNLKMNIGFDTLQSTFSFAATFDPTNASHRRLFFPLTYQLVEIFDGRQLLFTGNIISATYPDTEKDQLIVVSGYAKTGVLSDSSIPPDLSLEVNQKNLRDITEDLIGRFGLNLVISPEVMEDALKLYEKSTANLSQSVGDYISALASQRNIIVSHTPAGDVLFTRPRKDRESIATYSQNVPTLKFNLSVNGQAMHSQVTVQRQSTIGSDIEGNETVKNPMVQQYRPLVKEQQNGAAGDTMQATQNAIASELKNIALTIETDRWLWFNGRVLSTIQVNNYVDVITPKLFFTRRTNMFVQGVAFNETQKKRTATLTCVIPETFNGDPIRQIFT